MVTSELSSFAHHDVALIVNKCLRSCSYVLVPGVRAEWTSLILKAVFGILFFTGVKESFFRYKKMPLKGSPLANFLMDALMKNKYPGVLYWVDKTEGIFCLRCICKNKTGWSQIDARIFEDYHKLKPRKSKDKRQRLLLALKTSPCIKTLKGTKEEKFYKFLNKTENLSRFDILCCELKHEGEVSCSTNVDMQVLSSELKYEDDFATESPSSADAEYEIYEGEYILCHDLKHEGEVSCSTNVDMQVLCKELKNEDVEIATESPSSENIDIEVDWFKLDPNVLTADSFPTALQTTIVESVHNAPSKNGIAYVAEDSNSQDILDNTAKILSEQIGDALDSIFNISEADFNVPDVIMDSSEQNDDHSQSLFSGDCDSNSFYCDNSFPNIIDLCQLEQGPEIPNDYDPEMDLLQSFENKKTSSQLNFKDMPNLISEASQYEVKGIYPVDSKDVVKLFLKDDEIINNNHSKNNYYMMVLKTLKS
ncbi:IRF tryptophan pentad repeat domain-containing protein [Nephila pilipes]|uniref:IRF tryptophan pentad repeat domain-containing protein n=1 Tax=Nephila pilipes TaxID=299642 RepID=A0A8X6U956_NEPPI|nr:IRF tryptophan pentad repeat domain-containing protein [Nephila pilipes]